MARDPRWDILFEPVRIGPVTAPNRFYQVPHASGMTNVLPKVRASFREVKAEGGWGVICTGAVSIHPSSDDSPLPAARIWDEHDIRAHALMTQAVHRHGALAGIELWHGGATTMNRSSRIPPLSPSGIGWMSTHVGFMSNQRARAMDLGDIKALLGWYRDAAIRAKKAGFDIIYVYAGMGYLLHEFLLPGYNRRTDAYGGSVANRCRLIREALETVKAAVGDTCGVALRISLEELRGRPGTVMESEAHEVVAELAEIPDLWDVKMDSSPTDCSTSRFAAEGSHEPTIDFVKRLTTKPVVGVGRFTSPDTMVSQIKRGVLDLIGGARPSIADPFLPRKLNEGREDEIRECIGCNICIASWHDGVPIRCTQNPTIGEEWRRDWHPERFAKAGSSDRVLVIGAGPAGLDCALTLARRGYEVAVADRGKRAGGRVLDEAALPGLNAWRRLLDYRLGGLSKLANAQIYLDSEMGSDEVLGFGAERVVIATGADWVPARYDPRMETPGDLFEGPGVFTPQDVFAGRPIEGPVTVFDYDNYYMGGCIAEKLAGQGLKVTYVTPAGFASAWTIMTNEQPNIHARLEELGVEVITRKSVAAFAPGEVTLEDIFTRGAVRRPAATLVVVGHRVPRAGLHDALIARQAEWAEWGVRTVDRIGDAAAPGALVHAIHSGHLYARSLDAPPEALPYRIDNGLDAITAPLARSVGGETSAVSNVLELSLPSASYTDPGAFAAEKAAIFTREWMVGCRAEEVAGPGAWRVIDLVGESVLLVRGKDGALNAFYNVCRHRGAQLCPSPGAAKPGRAELPGAVSPAGLIRCPYHAWTYSPAGALIGAPFLSDDPTFRREDFSLYPVGCVEWGGFVFLHLSPQTAGSLTEQLGPATGRIANYPLADLRIGHRLTYEVEANWKILCENYNECYHCGPLHPELCAIVPAFRAAGGSGLEWERGIPHREGATTFTWSGTTDRAPFPGLNEDEQTRHKGELIYPNLFLSLAADHVAAFVLQPKGPALTQIECLFLFAPDEIARPGFDHTDASGFWDLVNEQDWAICERVQQGMGSRAHVQGFYAPMEDANLDMRRYILARMKGD